MYKRPVFQIENRAAAPSGKLSEKGAVCFLQHERVGPLKDRSLCLFLRQGAADLLCMTQLVQNVSQASHILRAHAVVPMLPIRAQRLIDIHDLAKARRDRRQPPVVHDDL